MPRKISKNIMLLKHFPKYKNMNHNMNKAYYNE